MTSPAEAKSWPQDPTMPSAAPAGYVTPTAPPPNPGEPPMTPGEVEARRGQFIELIFQQVVKAIFGFFSPALGTAFSQVAGWAADIFSIPQNIINAFTGIGGVITGPFTGVFDAIGGLLGIGNAAQATANTANVGVAILNARINEVIIGGASYSDTFSRSGSDLGADYFMKYGAGSGTMETTTANSGTTVWIPAGFSDRFVTAINTLMPMTTNRVRVSLVVDQFTFGFAGDQANVYLIARSDIGLDNYVVAKFGNLDVSGPGTCEVGYVLSNVYTRLGSQVAITTAFGDLWDFEVGTVADALQFRLVQNNALRVDQTDSGAASLIDGTPGTTYKYTGFGADCYIGAGPFGTTYQGAPPPVQVLAAADY